MTVFEQLLAELRRRGVIRVAIGYGLVAWVLAQASDLAADAFAAPDWFMPSFLILLLAGLPAAIILAWFYDLSPSGLRRDVESAEPFIATRLITAFALLCTFLVSLAIPLTKAMRSPPDSSRGQSAVGGSPTNVESGPAVRAEPLERSVAVLPFSDLSPSGDQSWFAAGLAEEILTALSGLAELRVAASSSSFRFENETRSIGEIAESLRVGYVLRGSVRKFDNRNIVTAQLIRADDESHVWSRSYESDGSDLFDVQRDVAIGVADALDVFLDEDKRETMFRRGTRDPYAFKEYLLGVADDAAWHADPALAPDGGHRHFKRAMELDSTFAEPALARIDLFSHVLMDGIDLGYSAEEAYAAIMRDLEFAAANASDTGMQLTAEINRALFAPSWHRIPGLVERLRNVPNISPLLSRQTVWLSQVLLLTDRALARRLFEAEYSIDPLSPLPSARLGYLALMEDDPENALTIVARARRTAGDHPWLRAIEISALGALGRLEELVPLLERSNTAVHQAWLAAIRGNESAYEELAGAALAASAWPDAEYLVAFSAAGDHGRAATLAGRIDALPAGPAILGRFVTRTGRVLFDARATPRFAARIQEAGIDLPAP